MSQDRLLVVKAMQKANVNFRELINFKNALFDSSSLTPENKITTEEFERIRAASDHITVREGLRQIHATIAKEVCDEHSMVDLNAFCNLVDLYVYLPTKIDKQTLGVASPEIHLVMSSNKEDKATGRRESELEAGDVAVKRDL